MSDSRGIGEENALNRVWSHLNNALLLFSQSNLLVGQLFMITLIKLLLKMIVVYYIILRMFEVI